jgi:DNA-binding MarR family transcriptional regulator
MTAILEHLQQRRPFETLEEEVFVGLQLAANRSMEPWARYLREVADLSEVQYNVLRILRGAGPEGLRVQDLACRLITRRPDMTRLIQRLEKQGLADRRTDPVDGRAVRIGISQAGLERLASVAEHAREGLLELFQPLGRERLEALRDGLCEVLDAVRAMEARTGYQFESRRPRRAASSS